MFLLSISAKTFKYLPGGRSSFCFCKQKKFNSFCSSFFVFSNKKCPKTYM